MSRIGKVPISLPKGVDVKSDGAKVHVKGPKGNLSLEHHGRVAVKVADGQVHVARHDDEAQSRAFHGLYQRMISNMVKGVTDGFKKELEIQGVGYKAAMEGKDIVLNLGYSHQIRYAAPAGINITTPKPTVVVVEGVDKQKVGQVAAEIRSKRPPEPYKGKGVRYSGEYIKIKEGKKGTK